MKFFFCVILVISISAQQSTSPISSPDTAINKTMKSIQMNEILILAKGNGDESCLCDEVKSTENILGGKAGMALIRRGNFAQEAVIHGFFGEQIALTIDGMHVFGACTDKMDPISAYVEKNNLQKIELQTNSVDFTTGQNIGGSINLITAKPEFNNKLTYGISTGFECVNSLKKTDGILNFADERYSLRASFALKKAEDYSAGIHQHIKLSGFTKQNVKLDATYKLTPVSAITFAYIGDFAFDAGYPGMIMDARETNAGMYRISYNNSITGFLAWDADAKISIYTNSILHWMDDYDRSVDEINNRIIMPGMYMPMFGSTNTLGSNAELALSREGIILRFGYDAYHLNAFADMTMLGLSTGSAPMYLLNLGDAIINNGTLHGKLTRLFTDRFSMHLAVAYTLNKRTLADEDGRNMLEVYTGKKIKEQAFHLFSISISNECQIYNNLILFGSMSRSMRAPTHAESYGYFLYNLADNAIYMGKPDIQPEKSIQASTGFEFKNSLIRIKTMVFANQISDFIGGTIIQSPDPTNTLFPQAIKKYNNIGRARVYGVDISASLKWDDNFLFLSQFSFANGRALTISDNLPMMPPARGSVSITYGRTDWIGFESIFALKQDKTASTLAFEDTTPGFVIWNFRAGFNLTNFISVQMGIENIFDTLYHQHLSVNNIADPGRNIYITVGFQIE